MNQTERTPQARSLLFEDISLGDAVEITHILTAKDIEDFAKLTGDYNPLHMEEKYARKTMFRKPVVHGMLSASFISTLIGMKLPGKGALWTSQSLSFLKQAYTGDTLKISSTVKQKSPSTRSLVLDIVITNQNNEKLITGRSTVKMIDEEEEHENMTSDREKIVLITGASRGIGAATARILSSQGYSVIINYLHSRNEAESLRDEILKKGGNALAIQADLSSLIDVEAMLSKVEENLGEITAFVHCAADQNRLQPFSELSWDCIQGQFDVQVRGFFNCLKLLLPKMLEKEYGVVVAIGSTVSDGIPPTHQTDYVIAKSALTSFARSLANEYGPKGIRVNLVSPGMTMTDRLAEYPEKAKMLVKMATPLRRLAQPDDVAHAVSFLLSENAKQITGETLRVCGGATMI